MISRDYVTEWRAQAPWVQDFQVEQDLVISRALVEIFSHPLLHEALALRGGTALYKLHLKPAARYSEDIDLVQTKAEPAGPITFVCRFDSEDAPPVPLKLKIETNTREHFSVYGLKCARLRSEELVEFVALNLARALKPP